MNKSEREVKECRKSIIIKTSVEKVLQLVRDAVRAEKDLKASEKN